MNKYKLIDKCRISDSKKLVNVLKLGDHPLANSLKINQKEMYEGCSNIFSINKKTIVSDTTFTRLNKELERLNFLVEKVNYREISKFGGLFRCSTLPLERKS